MADTNSSSSSSSRQSSSNSLSSSTSLAGNITASTANSSISGGSHSISSTVSISSSNGANTLQPSAGSTDTSTSNASNLPVIIGCSVAGGVILLALILWAACIQRRRHKERLEQELIDSIEKDLESHHIDAEPPVLPDVVKVSNPPLSVTPTSSSYGRRGDGWFMPRRWFPHSTSAVGRPSYESEGRDERSLHSAHSTNLFTALGLKFMGRMSTAAPSRKTRPVSFVPPIPPPTSLVDDEEVPTSPPNDAVAPKPSSPVAPVAAASPQIGSGSGGGLGGGWRVSKSNAAPAQKSRPVTQVSVGDFISRYRSMYATSAEPPSTIPEGQDEVTQESTEKTLTTLKPRLSVSINSPPVTTTTPSRGTAALPAGRKSGDASTPVRSIMKAPSKTKSPQDASGGDGGWGWWRHSRRQSQFSLGEISTKAVAGVSGQTPATPGRKSLGVSTIGDNATSVHIVSMYASSTGQNETTTDGEGQGGEEEEDDGDDEMGGGDGAATEVTRATTDVVQGRRKWWKRETQVSLPQTSISVLSSLPGKDDQVDVPDEPVVSVVQGVEKLNDGGKAAEEEVEEGAAVAIVLGLSESEAGGPADESKRPMSWDSTASSVDSDTLERAAADTLERAGAAGRR